MLKIVNHSLLEYYENATRTLEHRYGFQGECVRRLGEKDANSVLSVCWTLFEYLPLACLVDERVLCLHGGLGKHVKDIDQIRRIKKPVKLKPGFVHEDPVVVDILWSDPVRSSSSRIPHARTWCFSCFYRVTRL